MSDGVESVARAAVEQAVSGWARVDSDNVLRGWVTDRSDRARRLLVDVHIDDVLMMRRVASRLDPKLIELGEGDGCYAFACVIPEAFRDGQEHRFEARVSEPAFRLRSKTSAFTIMQGQSTPQISITRASLSRVRGQLTGGQYGKALGLELWSGETRLDLAVETAWLGARDGVREFELRLTPAVTQVQLSGPLAVAAPGMVEAELTVGLLPQISLALLAEIESSGLVSLCIDGNVSLEPRAMIEAAVARASDGAVVGQESVTLSDGRMGFMRLPQSAWGEPLTATVKVDGLDSPPLTAPVHKALGHLVGNGGFQSWEGQGPSGWTLPEGAPVSPGFYAFPEQVAQAHHLSGHYVRIALAASDRTRLVLSRPLASSLAEDDTAPASVMVRAESAGIDLRLRLADAEGAEIAGLAVDVNQPWTWTFATEVLRIARSTSGAMLELVAEAGAAVEIDIAGLAFGAKGFPAAPAPAAASPPPKNLVVNADLSDWPSGPVVEGMTERSEIARGWYGFNRGSAAPMRARAVVDDGETVALAFAAEAVVHYCRLEVRLDAAAGRLDRGVLHVEVGMPPIARRLFRASDPPLPDFLTIDRVVLLKRTRVTTEAGFTLVEQTLAAPGRKLQATRGFHAFELPFQCAKPAPEGDLDAALSDAAIPDAEGEKAEYFIAFEFRQPFALAVRRLGVFAAAPAKVAAQPYLSLEDRNIAAQAGDIVGLSSWVAPPPPTGEGRADLERQSSIPRWRWSAAQTGTVEVVVCNTGGSEALFACLAALIRTSQVPHTVHVVDGGDDAMTAQRLAAFISDKPWMRATPGEAGSAFPLSANGAIEQSDTEWVVVLRSDVIVTRGWLDGLLSAALSDPAAALVGPLSNAAGAQSLPELPDRRGGANDLPHDRTPDDLARLVAEVSERRYPRVPFLDEGCMLIRRSVFVEIGGFDRGATARGDGARDLCRRAAGAGRSSLIADNVYVYRAPPKGFAAISDDSFKSTDHARGRGSSAPPLDPLSLDPLSLEMRDAPALARMRGLVRRYYEGRG